MYKVHLEAPDKSNKLDNRNILCPVIWSPCPDYCSKQTGMYWLNLGNNFDTVKYSVLLLSVILTNRRLLHPLYPWLIASENLGGDLKIIAIDFLNPWERAQIPAPI